MQRVKWDPLDDDLLVALTRDGEPALVCAQVFACPMSTIYRQRKRLGLCQPHRGRLPGLQEFVQEKHPLGWSDAEIAAEWGCERHTIGDIRKRLGLPSNAFSEHFRRRVAAKTAQQCRAAGVPSLGALRVKVFRDRARRAGWPEDLRPRAVQILNALWDHGPMTRPELAAVIGMPWKGSRKSLVSNDPEGSYLAHLAKRGLVQVLKRGRKVTGKGRGASLDVYTLPFTVERLIVEEADEQQSGEGRGRDEEGCATPTVDAESEGSRRSGAEGRRSAGDRSLVCG